MVGVKGESDDSRFRGPESSGGTLGDAKGSGQPEVGLPAPVVSCEVGSETGSSPEERHDDVAQQVDSATPTEPLFKTEKATRRGDDMGSESKELVLKSLAEEQKVLQKQQILLQKQHMLCLLRHASKCTLGAACTIKSCPQMVRLWRHVLKCHNKDCLTPRCLFSRYAIHHYRLCKGRNECEVCGPVMKLKKAHEANDPTVAAQVEQLYVGFSDNSVTSILSEIRKETIQEKQQRLFLLLHASECTLGDECQLPFCTDGVKLWQHMKNCRDRQCQTRGCLTGRFLFNHHDVCKERNEVSRCELCAPLITHLHQKAKSDEESEQQVSTSKDSNGGKTQDGAGQSCVYLKDGAAEKQEQGLLTNVENDVSQGDVMKDRCEVTTAIVESLKKVRPEAQADKYKLPRMAKKLEEHLFATALTHEEHVNKSTLKQRLQRIARRVGAGGTNDGNCKAPEEKQRQRLLISADSNLKDEDRREVTAAIVEIIKKMRPNEMADKLSRMAKKLEEHLFATALTHEEYVNKSTLKQRLKQVAVSVGAGRPKDGNDKARAKGKTTVFQKQQRLFLLLHANECTLGAACTVRSCRENVAQCHHLKNCSDTKCATSGCLSGRYLVHYHRECRKRHMVSTCAVCAPVMLMDMHNGESRSETASNGDQGGRIFDFSISLPAASDRKTISPFCLDCGDGGLKNNENPSLDTRDASDTKSVSPFCLDCGDGGLKNNENPSLDKRDASDTKTVSPFFLDCGDGGIKNNKNPSLDKRDEGIELGAKAFLASSTEDDNKCLPSRVGLDSQVGANGHKANVMPSSTALAQRQRDPALDEEDGGGPCLRPSCKGYVIVSSSGSNKRSKCSHWDDDEERGGNQDPPVKQKHSCAIASPSADLDVIQERSGSDVEDGLGLNSIPSVEGTEVKTNCEGSFEEEQHAHSELDLEDGGGTEVFPAAVHKDFVGDKCDELSASPYSNKRDRGWYCRDTLLIALMLLLGLLWWRYSGQLPYLHL